MDEKCKTCTNEYPNIECVNCGTRFRNYRSKEAINKRYLKKWLIWILVWFSTYVLWAGLELIMYGEVQPRGVDNVIGLILNISLYSNIIHYLDLKH